MNSFETYEYVRYVIPWAVLLLGLMSIFWTTQTGNGKFGIGEIGRAASRPRDWYCGLGTPYGPPRVVCPLYGAVDDRYDCRDCALTSVKHIRCRHMIGSKLIARALPDRILAYLDYQLRRHRKFDPWGGPMNGQTARLETCRQILTSLGVTRIVETGTYRGVTTEWFAQFGLPVVTFESNKRFAAFAARRLRKHPNVRVVPMDSVGGLRSLAQDSFRNDAMLYYLDAHWEDHLPLPEELAVITEQSPRAIMLIDDFAVDGDPHYGFDDYGAGKALNLDYLRSHGFAHLSAFFPTTKALSETGVPRGYVFLTADNELASSLERMPQLRRASRPS
jgi:predicted O-methyltransferase YrrM